MKEYLPAKERVTRNHDIRGVSYNVSEWGDRRHPLLMLLHGWGDCGATFQFVADQLQQDWFVVAPDWRGFGDSACRSHSYWFPDYLADLHALLEAYSPDRAVNLIGHSMGANVAGLYAGTFPERVASYINIEGFGLNNRDPADTPANYRRWIEQGRRLTGYRDYASFEDLALRVMQRGKQVTEPVAHFVARQWGRESADGKIVIKADPAHKLPNAVLYRRAEAEACWSRVAAPVLAILGKDSEFNNGQQLDSMSFASIGAVTIAEAGHMIHFEQPAALAAAIESFLVNPSSTV